MGMPPPQQGLQAVDPAVFKGDDGLIIDQKFSPFQGGAQIRFELEQRRWPGFSWRE